MFVAKNFSEIFKIGIFVDKKCVQLCPQYISVGLCKRVKCLREIYSRMAVYLKKKFPAKTFHYTVYYALSR